MSINYHQRNIHLANGDFNILCVDPNNVMRFLVEDKYGICSILKDNLRKNYKPSIVTAIDKNSYFTNKAREVHGDKYDYSKVDYNLSENYLTIICPEHGEFKCSANNHLRGKGCRLCWHVKDSKLRRENPTG